MYSKDTVSNLCSVQFPAPAHPHHNQKPAQQRHNFPSSKDERVMASTTCNVRHSAKPLSPRIRLIKRHTLDSFIILTCSLPRRHAPPPENSSAICPQSPAVSLSLSLSLVMSIAILHFSSLVLYVPSNSRLGLLATCYTQQRNKQGNKRKNKNMP